MLKITQKGIQATAYLNPALIAGTNQTGVIWAEPLETEALLAPFVGGRLIALDSEGFVVLADGAVHPRCAGFLINSATSGFFENKPALSQGQLGFTFGHNGLTTDQIAPGITFAPMDELYAGTGANAGLVTNVKPSVEAISVGWAGSIASPANPTLVVWQI